MLFILWTETLFPLNIYFSFSPPPAPDNLLLFVSVDLTSLGIFEEVESYSICPFVIGVFHTA